MFISSIKKFGFTMIELLIVIAVLGILAVAVLSAINPIEQINRGRDTGSRSDAEQLLSASDRYYAGKGFYPWANAEDSLNVETSVQAGTPVLIPIDSATVTPGQDDVQFLTVLSAGGAAEIKASFVSRITSATYNDLSIYNDGISGSSTYICFTPKSSSFREEAWKRCVDNAGVAADMPDDFPADACLVGATCTTAATAIAATGCMICLP